MLVQLLLRCLLPAVALGLGWWLFVYVQGGPDFARGTPERGPTLVVVDSSGYDNHGVNQGAPVLGLPGRKGTAYSFQRDGSWVQVPSRPFLNPGGKDFRVSAWVNLTATPGDAETYDIIRKGHSYTPGGEFKLEIYTGGFVRCTAKGSSRVESSVTASEENIADGTWHRVGCARTGTKWQATVDRKVSTKTVDLGRIFNTVPLSIGSKYGLEDGLPGRVDEVRLAIFDPPVNGETWPDPPQGVWHLDERPDGPPAGGRSPRY